MDKDVLYIKYKLYITAFSDLPVELSIIVIILTENCKVPSICKLDIVFLFSKLLFC